MNNKTELQSILQSKYNRSNWQKLFQDIFPQISLYATPKEIIIPEKALEGRIEKLFQLGTVRLQDGRDIKIFELKLTEKVKLYKNKVEMRNLISKFIDIGTDNGVLAIFDSADEDYRLTFSAKDVYLSETEGMVNKETDSKRYTYLLGPNESCRTAAERLFDLYENKNELTLEQLTKAFSVEKLNKQFFADYTGIYEKFTDYLGASYDKKKKETDTVISGEFSKYFKDKVEAREFVKKLMGRVVFIHFVQKKGWMGCSPATKKWEKGNKEFLWNFWESCTDKGHFYSKYLTELFFNGFNVKRENDIFALTGNRIPFLNGGLFSNDRPKTNVIDFPIEIFGEFLEKLNFYNFTIDENDPFEVEVGIDPEMLGHIFENLLEENKEKGAFYTPKIIVEYMCKESLIAYLQTGLVENKVINDKDAKAHKQIEVFIKEHEKLEDNQFISRNKDIIDKLLQNVKICDPAVGSGAFPMGMLKEITWARMVLENTEDVYKIKKEAIANSLYGVDIDPGAIDIARLRYWLALVVDAYIPEPLPNLDYKLMQGNSLLESFEDIDLSKVMEDKFMVETVIEKDQEVMDFYDDKPAQQQIVFSDDRKNRIIDLKNDYYAVCDINRKNEIHSEIDKIVIDHIESCLEIYKDNLQLNIENMEIQLEKQSQYKSDEAKEYICMRSSKGKQLILWNQEMDLIDEKYKALEKLEYSRVRPYFLWHLYFSEVFDSHGGFDIVIGNPPYFSGKSSAFDNINKKYYNKNFDTAEYQLDLYILFSERGLNLSNEGGILTYIMPNTWLANLKLVKIRKYLLDNSSILKIVINPDNIFQAAVVDTIILITQRKHVKANTISIYSFLNWKLEKLNSVNQNIFYNNNRFIFDIHLDDLKRAIIKKIENSSYKVKEICTVNRGVHAYRNDGYGKSRFAEGYQTDRDYLEKSYHSDTKLDKTYHNEVRGKNIFPYFYKSSDKFVSWGDWLAEPRDWDFFTGERIYLRKIVGETLYAAFVEKDNVADQSVYIAKIKDSRFKIRYLLSLLNSKLITWYFRIKANEFDKLFPQIKVTEFKELPIKMTDKQFHFINIVDIICLTKKAHGDSKRLEILLNLLVYKLYDLSYQEAKIVDPELDALLSQFGLSKEDYENMGIEELSGME
jgi:type I restriction-modification system DNA methylase subunit